ncbi:hypothetical protein GEV33_000481 [Tenebrio molitor]|uniref:Uncharacterized protein n=1 Tax=Tenebrio molitor TaxID=7067 RepID=A0A8J6HP49_TENMO|nr:hypothetical protein GEV33_000481 [Tenebrio molitor]
MTALAARKFSLFPQGDQQDSLDSLRTLSTLSELSQPSQDSFTLSSHTTSWRHHSVKPGQAGSEPRLRRSSAGDYNLFSETVRSTLEPLSAPLNHATTNLSPNEE